MHYARNRMFIPVNSMKKQTYFCLHAGLALLLPYCSYLDMVEYMPSTKLTSRCHYYDSEV